METVTRFVGLDYHQDSIQILCHESAGKSISES